MKLNCCTLVYVFFFTFFFAALGTAVYHLVEAL